MSHEQPPFATSARASRRDFVKAAGAAAVAGSLAPSMVWASDKSGSKLPVIGEGEHTYEVHHGWGELPESVRWGETHGVGIDEAGQIYVKHMAVVPEPVMDAIVVFDPDGKYVHSFGKEYHGGGHGLDIRKEGGEEFLYLCDIKNRIVVKTNLKGEHVWQMDYPREANLYQEIAQFRPTNVAFHPEGGFYVADGYGSNYVHQYDKDAKWVRSWGGTGAEQGQFSTPHGIWLDNRPGREPSVVVADRANARLQYFTLDGVFKEIVKGVSFPAHFDLRGTEMLIPDLHARVTIMDADNKIIANLGYDEAWTKKVLDNFQVRGNTSLWEDGKFIHPHDACWDKDGNIFVVEWVPTGRVTKLRKVS